MFRVSHSLTLRRWDEVPGRWFKRLGMTSQINCNSKDFDFGSYLQKRNFRESGVNGHFKLREVL